MNDFTYKIDYSSVDEIINHLTICSEYFTPALDTYVNIEEYSKKLFSKATNFEVLVLDKLVGLISVYLNDKVMFITNFSTDPDFFGGNVSKSNLYEVIKYGKRNNYNKIKLEVFKNNKRAINFYNKNDFKIIDTVKDKIIMEIELERDYNKEYQDTTDHKYAYNFDFDVMHGYMIKSFKPFFRDGNCLELGSFKGDFTKRLIPFFDDITCVEASSEAINISKDKYGDKITYFHNVFENVNLPKKYDNIILTHVLEHIDDPVGLMSRIKNEWLAENGRLFIVCPNANAPSRQIAVKMGLISHNSAITPSEKDHGHRITYSLDTLERDAKEGGLNVEYRTGIFFKSLANFQWDKLLETDIISKEYLDGCYQLGHHYPDLCSSIMLVCKK